MTPPMLLAETDKDQKRGELIIAEMDFLILDNASVSAFPPDKIVQWCKHLEGRVAELKDQAADYKSEVPGHEGLVFRMDKKLYTLHDQLEDLWTESEEKYRELEKEVYSQADATGDEPECETETIMVAGDNGEILPAESAISPDEIRKCDACWNPYPVGDMRFLGREPDDLPQDMYVNPGGWRYLCNQSSCQYAAAAAGDIADPFGETDGERAWKALDPFGRTVLI